MRSIQRRFEEVRLKNEGLSSIVCFTRSIKNQKFTKGILRRWFNKLVEKSDYDSKDKKNIINHLAALSNSFEDNQK